MVHFNRLKPCQRDTKLDIRTKQLSSDYTEPSQARHNDVQAPPPIGTNLEIADYDDDATLADHQNTVKDVHQNSARIRDQPLADMRRYPVREQRPPARLQDYVRT